MGVKSCGGRSVLCREVAARDTVRQGKLLVALPPLLPVCVFGLLRFGRGRGVRTKRGPTDQALTRVVPPPTTQKGNNEVSGQWTARQEPVCVWMPVRCTTPSPPASVEPKTRTRFSGRGWGVPATTGEGGMVELGAGSPCQQAGLWDIMYCACTQQSLCRQDIWSPAGHRLGTPVTLRPG